MYNVAQYSIHVHVCAFDRVHRLVLHTTCTLYIHVHVPVHMYNVHAFAWESTRTCTGFIHSLLRQYVFRTCIIM